MKVWIARVALTWLALAVAGAATAQEWVDVELVLAVDVSSSVDNDEYELQMRGLAEAFRNPDVLDAIRATGGGGIVVSLVQWSDNREQALAIDWTPVSDPSSAELLAQSLLNQHKARGPGLASNNKTRSEADHEVADAVNRDL